MDVAPMNRLTKRAYFWLCPEKRRKNEFGRIKVNILMNEIGVGTVWHTHKMAELNVILFFYHLMEHYSKRDINLTF